MKFDSGMMHFHGDIAKALLHWLKPDKELEKLVIDGDPKPLREYLKDKLKNSGYSSPYEPFCVSCSISHMEIRYKSRVLNNNGEKTLTLSWSQLATLLRNENFFNKYFNAENSEMIIPSKRTPPADVEKPVSERYIEALNLNSKIIVSAQLAQQNLYEMCTGFKKMRDDKLYKELGYANFEEYCEQETGINRNQAYKYITVVEKLPSDFVSSRIQNTGISKLIMLAKISEEARAEIVANNDLESTTVKELEKRIKELEESNERQKKAFDGVADQSKENYRKYLDEMHKHEVLACECSRLEQKCKELENRPIEVATQIVEKIPDDYITRDAYEKMAASYVEQLGKADDELIAEKRRAYAEREELEKKIAELENAPREENSEELFTLLCQMCRHPLSRLALFVDERPIFKSRFEQFVAENIKI